MAATSRYRRFLKLVEAWPVDVSKTGRDLGQVIRSRIADGFRQGDATQVDPVECDRIFNSMQRIALNVNKKRYPRSSNSCATGLSLEDCQKVTSTEGVEFLRNYKPSFLERIKPVFRLKS